MPKLSKMALKRPPAALPLRVGSRRGGLYLGLPLLVVCAYVALIMVAPFWMTRGVDGNSPSTSPSGGNNNSSRIRYITVDANKNTCAIA